MDVTINPFSDCYQTELFKSVIDKNTFFLFIYILQKHLKSMCTENMISHLRLEFIWWCLVKINSEIVENVRFCCVSKVFLKRNLLTGASWSTLRGPGVSRSGSSCSWWGRKRFRPSAANDQDIDLKWLSYWYQSAWVKTLCGLRTTTQLDSLHSWRSQFPMIYIFNCRSPELTGNVMY